MAGNDICMTETFPNPRDINSRVERAIRRRVLKGVKIAFAGDFCAIEGVMKNISETGALISTKNSTHIPDHIVIFNELDGYKIAAEVVRRGASELGIRFLGYAEPIETTRAQIVNMIDLNETDTQTAMRENPYFNEEFRNTSSGRSKPAFGKRNA